MLHFLKDHPFAVEAFFEHSLVLTFALPKAQLENQIPECLELDTFQDQWAFVAIALVQTKHLRPKGIPKFLGNNFFLIGYRVFVRYHDSRGKRLRGLYILKSETNKKKMEFFGNIFTHYNYTTTDISQSVGNEQIKISSTKSDFGFTLNTANKEADLPVTSPFSNWKEARRFAGPLPFTFTYTPSSKKVLIIEGVRQFWKPQPVEVLDYRFSFLAQEKFEGHQLANAFMVSQIPYQWKKGRVEIWNQ